MKLINGKGGGGFSIVLKCEILIFWLRKIELFNLAGFLAWTMYLKFSGPPVFFLIRLIRIDRR